MIEQFLFIGLPYLAIAAFAVGTYYRLTKKEYTVTSLSSQFLEGKFLLWGSVPWHIGIMVIFFGHLIPFLAPSLWQDLVKHKEILYAVEAVGFMAAVLCAFGLIVLIIRRILSRTLQIMVKPMEFVVYALLLSQIVLGMLTAYNFRYGSVWATGTLFEYLYGIILLSPDATFIVNMPVIIQAHVVIAWLILLLIPFTRLIHMFSVPIEYFIRLPQKVVWTNELRWQKKSERAQYVESRRYFFRGVAGIAGASGLLSLGVLEKTARYFKGEQLDGAMEASLLEKRLKRLKLTMEEKTFELERLKNDRIYIAELKELNNTSGKYFIDYAMKPALAFKTEEGLPNLISAKCTHLGCTVGKDVDEQGRITCPCHVSLFDISTGIPTEGSPTQEPLPFIEWMVQDQNGAVVAQRGSDGKVVRASTFDIKNEESYKVFIIKPVGEAA